MCVVIDTKPRRFRSLCQFILFVSESNRKSQVNFLQKGDCYDISKIYFDLSFTLTESANQPMLNTVDISNYRIFIFIFS